ncbi:DUF3017 domain-containing protein [Streptomyces sp. NPDC005776]|uniref:DUF3017 domain-containing protein n=1 Tax=Streptomyces sp. NPDC005776 TaxID=3154676 RepID=UPI003400C918
MAADTSPADRAASASGPDADGAGAPAEPEAAEARTGSTASDATASDAIASDASASDTTASETGEAGGTRRGRRFSLTRDTARPEGGGRAAGGDAPAPARQWPLLAVLCTAGAGLLIVAADPFDQAFRIGTILIGVALIGGAVLRLVVPSVGMLAVRSRFTDLVTYGLLGVLIVMLSLMAQPEPWLDIPFLEDAVHFTIR